MRTRIAIAALIYPMVQAIAFGAGMLLVLLASPTSSQQTLIPWMIALTFPISLPIAWMIAPRLRARFRRGRTAPPRG